MIKLNNNLKIKITLNKILQIFKGIKYNFNKI